MPKPSNAVTALAGHHELLDVDAVCKFFGGTKALRPTTIVRGSGTQFPKPIKVAPGEERWLRSECEASLQKMIERSRN